MKGDFSRQIFEKYSNKKFHENPSSRGRVFPYGWMDSETGTNGQIDRQTGRQTDRDMSKIIVAPSHFANAHK